MKIRNIYAATAALLTLVLAAPATFACSTFMVKAQDGTIISARTMEFGYNVPYTLTAVPKGTEITSPSPEKDKAGLSWKTAYKYLGVSSFNQDNIMADGMNEVGLAVSGLWFEANTKWPEVKPSEHKKALAHSMLIAWILGNCKDVADVKAKLAEVKVFGQYIPEMKMVTPLHFEVDDAAGNSLVIEAQDGKLNLYDNPVGVITNAPNFPYMLNNLRNFTYFKNSEAPAMTFGSALLQPTGHGSGMFGLPGDLTPPSRFVRLAVQIHFADPVENQPALLNLAQHIANSVDIVMGMAVDKDDKGNVISSESTQWTSFRDLTNRVWYYHTYGNLNLLKIDLKALPLADGKIKRLPVYGPQEVIADITQQFK